MKMRTTKNTFSPHRGWRPWRHCTNASSLGGGGGGGGNNDEVVEGRRPHRLPGKGEVCHHARSLPRILAGARTGGITAIHGVCNTIRTVQVQSDAVRSTWGSCYVDGQRPARLRRLRSSLSQRCRHTQRQLGGTLAAHAGGSADAPRSRVYCKTQLVMRLVMRRCGHIIGNGEVQPEETKVEAVRNYPTPRTKKQVQAFLGLTGYYRKFIQAYADLAATLNDLTKKNAPNRIRWCEKAFLLLKDTLCLYPILKSPDFNREFILQTDASDRGVGAVLSAMMGTSTP